MSERYANDLIELLGEDGFFRLCEVYAGVQQFVPKDPAYSEMPEKVGLDVAMLLSKAYGGDYIRVPLARTFRARRYRDAGLSTREIAIKLGLTESGVEKIFIREKKVGRELKSRRDPRQLDFFS